MALKPLSPLAALIGRLMSDDRDREILGTDCGLLHPNVSPRSVGDWCVDPLSFPKTRVTRDQRLSRLWRWTMRL
jgi:hypothetical protein